MRKKQFRGTEANALSTFVNGAPSIVILFDRNIDYLDVFRFAGSTAFAGYSLALAQTSIWFGKSWSNTIKSMFDGLIYALLTAGPLGWLWPR